VPGYPRRLLPILGLGRIGTQSIHLGEHAIQGGNLGEDLFVFRALKLKRQLIHSPLDLGARELLWQYEVDRHRRYRQRTEGQARWQVPYFIVTFFSRSRRSAGSDFYFSTSFAELHIQSLIKERCSILGRFGKPFIHFFLVGDELLDAWALLHALEMRHNAAEA
jgi:hypothetical protein